MKEKSFERKNELIEAALDEFTRKSYENASLNVIIKNAGISKGTFYYHFKDKQALYLFLLVTANNAEWEFVNNRMEERTEEFEGKDIFERIKLQGRIGIEFTVMFPKYEKLGMMFAKEKGNKIHEQVMGVLEDDVDVLLEEMIKKAIKDGDFNNRFSKDFIMKIMSYLFFNFYEILNVEEDYDSERVFKDFSEYVDFMKYGLGK